MIERLIPHRPPFRLIDSIDRVDMGARTIRGSRRLREDDPVFAGHFPGTPVYPGVLQVETMGQLGLCLAGLLGGHAVSYGQPPQVRAIRIHNALFIEALAPGDSLAVTASLVEDNGLTAICAGQIFRGEQLCSCAIQEVCFVG
jgi:3-hydroxymyristoyl/3-hydroxydecanoyl-(acyl carrier protein) dehydratase